MGQQQLLLVILVTIIVGIATVVAINTFGAAADSANLDAVRQDMGSIAASAQGFYMKPAMLGGGGKSFVGMDFNDLAFGGTISTDGMTAWNENGTYQLSGATGTGSNAVVTLTAAPASADGYVEESVTGPAAADILTATISPDNMSFTN